MAKQNSSGFKLYIVETTTVNSVVTEVERLITQQMSLDYDRTTDTIDVTSKDNNGYEEFLGGLKSGEATVEYICDFDVSGTPGPDINHLTMSTYEATRAIKKYRAKLVTPLGATFKTDFNALITKFTTKAPMEDKITCSLTLKRSGAPTETFTLPA